MHISNRYSESKGFALVLLSAIAFGLMPIFAKLAYQQMNLPQASQVKTLLAIRFCIAAVCMWLLWAWQRKGGSVGAVRLRITTILPLVALGALGYVGQSFSYFTAVSIISAAATGLLLYTYPILVTVMAWIFFHESLTARKVVALALASLGALMVLGVVGSLLGLNGSSIGTLDPTGAAWGIAAAVIYSVYIIAGTRFTAGIPPIFSSATVISSAALVYLLWGALSGEMHLDVSCQVWFWGACIAVICTCLAIVAFFAGLKLIGPSRTAIASMVEPATTVLLAALILQESITAEQVAGGILILAAVLVLQWPARQPRAALELGAEEALPVDSG